MASKTIRVSLLCSAALLSGILAVPAFAQAADEEVEGQRSGIADIVVTARRREESIQDTPVSVTAVNAAIIEERGIENFVDLAKITPNVKIHDTPGGIGAAAIYMRGIGYGDNIIGNDAPFGFYIDGVPFGRISTAAMDIVEPDSIQVLRGPQGTLFGRNSTGGAIVVQTHTPEDEFGGVVSLGYGSFEAIKYKARIDTGLIGGSNIKASFAYSHSQRNGIVDVLTLPDHLDKGWEDNDSYWGKIQGEWGNFKATLSADYTKMTGDPVPLQVVVGTANFLAMLAASPNLGGNTIPVTRKPLFRYDDYIQGIPQRIVQKGVHLTLEYGLNDNLTLKAIGGLRAYRRDDSNNYGPDNLKALAIPAAIAFSQPPANWPAPVLTSFLGWYGVNPRYQKQNQKTLEVQLLGEYDSLNFVIGGFYFDEDAEDFGTTTLPVPLTASLVANSVAPRFYTVASKSKAVFAQVDYRPPFLGEKLELTAGVRYTDDSRDFVQTVSVARTLLLNEDNVSYILGANYEFTDDIMAYVRYSTGYRAGGFNARTTAAGVNPAYDPEKIKSLEGGIKLQALDNRLRLNVAAFYNKYLDLQVAQFAPPGGAGGGGNVNVNANAKYKGFEIEATVVPVDGFTIQGSYGYVDPEYTAFPRPLAAGATPTAGCVASTAGLQDCRAIQLFQNLPKTKWDVSAVYEFPEQSFGTFSMGVDYSWTGKTAGVLATNSPFLVALANRAYGLLGARMALKGIPINDSVTGSLALFGRNLTDRRYSTASIDFGANGTQNFPERRTMGIEAKVEF
jgi:iron complex outermembrane receptor protein